MHMAILFASYVNICTLQNKLTWENNYQHMMEFLINIHILKYIYVLEVPL